MLSTEALATYEAALQNLHEALTVELSTMGVHNLETDDWEMRLDDEAVSEADDNLLGDLGEAAEERISTLALLETRYRNVVLALKKMPAGTFGICELSGEPIETKRLDADPTARTCIAHKEDEYELPL